MTNLWSPLSASSQRTCHVNLAAQPMVPATIPLYELHVRRVLTSYTHLEVRFGRWQDLIALEMPLDKDLHCVTTAMMHYCKSVAYAVTGDIANAQQERDALVEAVERIPASRICGDFPNGYSIQN